MVDLELDELLVKASDRSYNLKFFNNLDKLVHEVKSFEKNTFYIIDKKFNDLNHFDTYLQQDNTLLINSSEKIKTLEFAKDLILQLKEREINRYSTIVTVGGGTLQDVSQFVASILYRGVDFVFIPTTLQAMTDSCMGGKTSLNLDFFKNQLGSFYSPKKVLIHTGFIKTLDQNELKGGYAELIKLLIIGKFNYFEELYSALNKDLYNLETVKIHSSKALQVKKFYVEADEFDVGIRKILNYGHTFAHAIETVVENKISHGNATALGMNLANYYSLKNDLISSEFYKLHYQFFYSFCDFKNIRKFKNINGSNLLKQFTQDKKIKSNGNIDLIIPVSDTIQVKEVEIDKKLENIVDEFLRSLF